METIQTIEVAGMIGCSIDKVYEFIKTGVELKTGETIKLPAHNLSSGLKRATWRFYRDDVRDFLHALRVNQLSPQPKPDPVHLSRRWIRRQPQGAA